MSPVRGVATPRNVLYRIGRLPDSLAWPPCEFVGDGRFDDPQRVFRVLYTTAQRPGAFVETLTRLRPSLELLARLRQLTGSEELVLPGAMPADWYQRRAVGRIRLMPGHRWLDLRELETREALRSELAPTLLNLGLSDLDLSGVLGPRRALTQAIARWAYERRYGGLVYGSRFDEAVVCWAVFEGAAFEPASVSHEGERPPRRSSRPWRCWAATGYRRAYEQLGLI